MIGLRSVLAAGLVALCAEMVLLAPATPDAATPVAAGWTATPTGTLDAGRALAGTPTVARSVARWAEGVPVRWTDATPCGTRGTATRAVGCVSIERGEPTIWLAPASLGGTYADTLTLPRLASIRALVRHEVAHTDIITRCGTAAPPIAGDRYEHVADAWAVTYRDARSLRAGGYGYTPTDAGVARAIHEGDCKE